MNVCQNLMCILNSRDCSDKNFSDSLRLLSDAYFSMVQINGDSDVQGSFQVGYSGIAFNVTYFYPSSGGGSPSFNVSPASGGGVSMMASKPIISGMTMTCTLSSS